MVSSPLLREPRTMSLLLFRDVHFQFFFFFSSNTLSLRLFMLVHALILQCPYVTHARVILHILVVVSSRYLQELKIKCTKYAWQSCDFGLCRVRFLQQCTGMSRRMRGMHVQFLLEFLSTFLWLFLFLHGYFI